jgi:hypothetical protein
MKHTITLRNFGLAGLVVFAGLITSPPALAASVDDEIAQALLPLPEDLRAGATVVKYDPATGARIVLRPGTNAIECEPMNPDTGFIRCYNKVTVPRHEFEAKLRAQKKTDDEVRGAVAAAIKDGTLKVPPFGTMAYRLTFKEGVIKNLWIMSVPYATSESIGVSTVSQRDAAMQGKGIPWLMLAGTPGAHVMIPIGD